MLYSTVGFCTGISVTGYLIFPNRTRSAEVTFVDLGDGIYAGDFPYQRQTNCLYEKYGVVIKENGVPRFFGTVQMIN